MNNVVSSENKISYKALLSEKEYIKLLCSQVISRFGDSVDVIAYGWMVYKLTGSATLIAILYGINGIPNLIFTMVSGVVSNYFKKKNIMIICDISRGVIVFLTAILFYFNRLSIWHLYVFTFLNSTFESFRQPASTVLYSYVIPQDKIHYAKSVDSSLVKIVELVGLGAAGVLIGIIGISGAIMVDAISFILSATLIVFIKVNNEYIKKEKLSVSGYTKDLVEGFKYIKNIKLLFQVTVFGAIFNLLVVPINSLESIYIGDVIKGSSYILSLFSICLVVGVIVGSIAVPGLKKFFSGKTLFISSGVIIGITYIGLALIPDISMNLLKYICLGATAFIMGASIPLINIQMSIVLLTKVDKELLSRVSATINALALCATPIGAWIAGALTTFISIPSLFFICSIILIAISLCQVKSKALREL